jgi:hypothetical protein
MNPILHRIISYFFASVWIMNGLYCKVLGYVPRHEQIVGRILGLDYAHILTLLIGISEILVSIWIISNIKHRLCVNFQIIIIVAMNILEFFLAQDLLLWGKLNIFFAFIFVVLLGIHEYILKPKINS